MIFHSVGTSVGTSSIPTPTFHALATLSVVNLLRAWVISVGEGAKVGQVAQAKQWRMGGGKERGGDIRKGTFYTGSEFHKLARVWLYTDERMVR